MTGQKQRIINRFRREAKKKDKKIREAGLNCICGKCNLGKFSLKEIEEIIMFTKNDTEDMRGEKWNQENYQRVLDQKNLDN